MVVIVNYGVGNSASIKNMLRKAGFDGIISSDANEIAKATKLILPGVGSFDHAVKNLRSSNFMDVLNKKVLQDKVPILGICLGMQLMTESSEEGSEKGLGWVKAKTVKFNLADKSVKIPHMGWNDILLKKQSKLFPEKTADMRFYFVHSYHVVCENPNDVLATCNYGGDFTCAFEYENIIGTQFHPEKSHKFGMTLLKNFITNY